MAREMVTVSVQVKADLDELKKEEGHTSLDSVIRTLILEHKKG
jgi:hypothetical protein